MGSRDPRVDAYLGEGLPEFARPRCWPTSARSSTTRVPRSGRRSSWSRPAFEYHGILCGLSAFKAHCTFGFWQHELVVGKGDPRWREAWGSFGRITKLSDLPSKTELKRMVRLAMKLNEAGVKAPRRKHAPKKPSTMPPALRAALAKNKKAKAHFDAFSPSRQREYVEWIGEAKGEDTRARRLARRWRGSRRGSTATGSTSGALRAEGTPGSRGGAEVACASP